MWICDAGQLYDSISDNWCGIGIANVSEILEFVKYAPTIDPEKLPVVRQLRAELAQVTADRDAAVRDLEQAITIYRDVEGWDILCRFCNGKSCLNDGECNPKWRGPQKEE